MIPPIFLLDLILEFFDNESHFFLVASFFALELPN